MHIELRVDKRETARARSTTGRDDLIVSAAGDLYTLGTCLVPARKKGFEKARIRM